MLENCELFLKIIQCRKMHFSLLSRLSTFKFTGFNGWNNYRLLWMNGSDICKFWYHFLVFYWHCLYVSTLIQPYKWRVWSLSGFLEYFWIPHRAVLQWSKLSLVATHWQCTFALIFTIHSHLPMVISWLCCVHLTEICYTEKLNKYLIFSFIYSLIYFYYYFCLYLKKRFQTIPVNLLIEIY